MTAAQQGPSAPTHRQQWQTEVTRWRCDVGTWHRECRDALKDLKRLEMALQAQETALQDYEEVLSAYEERLAAQEWVQAEAPSEDVESAGVLTPVSSEQASSHCRQQDAHERFRRRHYTLMAHWSLLCQTVTGALR
jgi:hypothetical protein